MTWIQKEVTELVLKLQSYNKILGPKNGVQNFNSDSNNSIHHTILCIGLTSRYCFCGSGSHFELGENITRYQA